MSRSDAMSTYSWVSRHPVPRFVVTANAHSLEQAREQVLEVIRELTEIKKKHSALEKEIESLKLKKTNTTQLMEELDDIYYSVPHQYRDAWDLLERTDDYCPGPTLEDFIVYLQPECGPINNVYTVTVGKCFTEELFW